MLENIHEKLSKLRDKINNRIVDNFRNNVFEKKFKTPKKLFRRNLLMFISSLLLALLGLYCIISVKDEMVGFIVLIKTIVAFISMISIPLFMFSYDFFVKYLTQNKSKNKYLSNNEDYSSIKKLISDNSFMGESEKENECFIYKDNIKYSLNKDLNLRDEEVKELVLILGNKRIVYLKNILKGRKDIDINDVESLMEQFKIELLYENKELFNIIKENYGIAEEIDDTKQNEIEFEINGINYKKLL